MRVRSHCKTNLFNKINVIIRPLKRKVWCKRGTNRWRKYGCYAQRAMFYKTTLTAVRLASIDRGQRGRCRRVEESQLRYFPRQPQRAACRRLPAAAAYLGGGCDPRAFYSAFAIATRPLLLLMPPLCGSAAQFRLKHGKIRHVFMQHRS